MRKKNVAQIDSELFAENEKVTNKLFAYVMIGCVAVTVASYILASFEFPKFKLNIIQEVCVCLVFLIPALICLYFKGERVWIKYMMIFTMILGCAYFDVYFSFYSLLFVICPTLMSSRYYSRLFTVGTALFTIVMIFCSSLIAYYGERTIESIRYFHLEYLSFPYYETLRYFLYDHFVDKMLLFIVPSVICIVHANNGRKLVRRQAKYTEELTEQKFEFSTAEKVQKDTLPDVASLRGVDDVDLYACMHSAKQTAGDFYDFFLVDDNTLALLIADVSDKGLPAAMFTLSSRNMIRSLCLATKNLQQAFSYTNTVVCQKNDDFIFVTAWMAFIDLKSGKCSYVNAGHVPPVLRKTDGSVMLIENEPEPFLGAVPDARYSIKTFDLQKGDTLLLYTDGVTDAENMKEERFEIEGLLNVVRQPVQSSKELCERIVSSISNFSGLHTQFDDITMLSLRWDKGTVGGFEEKTVEAVHENVSVVLDWIQMSLQKQCSNNEVAMLVASAVDDILSNIVDYAYQGGQGTFTVKKTCDAHHIELQFIDSGVPFNPLNAESPDLNDQERIGGLGIYLIKNIMDTVNYTYVDNKNIFTVSKNW